MVFVFFLEKNIPNESIQAIDAKIRKSPLVLQTKFVSSEQALERFQERFPELQGVVANLKINPFPPSFEATLRDKNVSSTETADFLQRMKEMPGIEDVQFNKEWVDRMQSLSRLVRAVGFFLGSILMLASFFIISNVIRLNVFARKNEIEILRLVGASNSFIRTPFLLEGTALGIIGGVFSLPLLLLVLKLFPLYLGSSLGVLNQLLHFRFLSFSQTIWLIAAGALIGLIGSLTSLSRFLKV